MRSGLGRNPSEFWLVLAVMGLAAPPECHTRSREPCSVCQGPFWMNGKGKLGDVNILPRAPEGKALRSHTPPYIFHLRVGDSSFAVRFACREFTLHSTTTTLLRYGPIQTCSVETRRNTTRSSETHSPKRQSHLVALAIGEGTIKGTVLFQSTAAHSPAWCFLPQHLPQSHPLTTQTKQHCRLSRSTQNQTEIPYRPPPTAPSGQYATTTPAQAKGGHLGI